MKTTIKMVAEYAGVSRGTVDRVIHNRGNVNSEVRQKVKDALETLDYRPNAIARALAFNKNTIKLGVLMPDNPGFFPDEIYRAVGNIQEECRDLGVEISVVQCNAMRPEQYAKAIVKMLKDGVCGFAICAQNSQLLIEKIDALWDQGIPVITVNSDIPDSKRRCFIGEDAIRCGRAAAEIICKFLKDEEDILVIGGIPEFTGHQNRVQGFRQYMQEKQISSSRYQIVYTYEKYDFAYEQLERILTRQPNIRNIYLGVESMAAYTDVIAKFVKTSRPFVVCHDTADHTLRALQDDLVDFSIDQDIYSQGYRTLQMLVDYFLYEKPIESTKDKIVLHIVTSECVG